LQTLINNAECGATVNIPAGDYDEHIVIHKCATYQVQDDARGRVRVKQGTDIDFNERDNNDCTCDDVTLIGFDFEVNSVSAALDIYSALDGNQ
jgi:hypothetical protein